MSRKFRDYAESDRPVWLDIATLNFERSDSWLSGIMVGFLAGLFVGSLIWWLL